MLRSPKLSIFAALGLVTLGSLACTDDVTKGDEGGGSCDLLAGDLVITEVVANVPGADAGLEWFEIYNASSNPIELEGRTLIYAKVDGTARKRHTIERSFEIQPGAYVTVGAVLDEVAETTAHLDYGYGRDLGEFGNSGGYLAIECGGQVIDEAYYAQVTDKASRALDGSQVPDAVANDSIDNWCDSRTEMQPGFAATPRAPNDVCGSQTSCTLGDQTVEVMRPQPGELVITEVMPNPDATGDDVGEWFEIRSLVSAERHLNGVAIGRALDGAPVETIAGSECIVLAPDSYAIVARNADAMVNGGLPAESIVWQTGMSLTNSNSSLWLAVGDELLDAVTWTSVGAGKAKQLDPGFSDPESNDELGNWCDASSAYGAGDLGTPGAENLACPLTPVDGQCNDGGVMRDIVPVELGDLVITEVLPNPDAVADTAGEWFEVLVQGSGDLNGLEIGKAGAVAHTIKSAECLSVSAGQYLVFARNDDPSVNGGLPQVDAVFNMSLNNSNSDLFIGYGGQVWDAVSWTSSTAGRTRSLSLGNFTTVANDDEALWCDGTGVYGSGDQGTPGQENPDCGGGPIEGACIDPDTNMMRPSVAPTLGDLIISELMPDPSAVPDADGEWFELYASASFDLNGLQIGKAGAFQIAVKDEQCIEVEADSWLLLARKGAGNGGLPQPTYVYDSGFSLNNSNGSLQIGYDDVVFDETTWASSQAGVALSLDMQDMSWCPAVDPYGDGDLGTPAAANPACDGGGGMEGMCFDGADWREINLPVAGDLVIAEIMANPSGPEPAHEWFEIRALGSFDLNGLWLGRDHELDVMNGAPIHLVSSNDCLPLTPGDTALFARSNEPGSNGGLPAVSYVYAQLALNNSNSGLYIASEAELLDQVFWTATSDGRSTSLDPGSYDPDLNDTANNALPWCFTPADVNFQYGDGGHGTPGADNQECG